MPAVRKNLPNATLDIARVRPRAPAKTPGLAQKLSSMFVSEAFIEEKSPNLPVKVMTDSEPVRLGKIGPETHTPIELTPEASNSRKGKEVVREKMIEHAETSARKFAVLAPKGTASTSAMEFPPEL